ncbi:MAG TPA: RNA polymerase subunit sigma [Advenella kashmirensis]|uniref:RNA polymerase subunit sigma n=1 Tax=Advenella kashmirensis TaxID=310575 RepID=A0A356LKA9_9BURK|nr:RNA polymerase subunit sigma [Advenella kashmirensis]
MVRPGVQSAARAAQSTKAQETERQLKALFLAGLDGDTQCYHAFLQALGGNLRAFLRRRLSDIPDEIEDIVQEILIAVHNARHTYLPDQPLTAWTYAIARYKMADYLRGRYRYEAWNEPLDSQQQELFAESDQEAAQARRDVDKLLSQLPDRYRLPILHVKLKGLTVAETAQLTGLSESAVKVGIHRGLKALAAIIRGTT